MTKYIQEHEKFVLEAIKQKDYQNDLLEYHNLQIKWLQHERLVHLLVLMLTSLLFMLAFVVMVLITNALTILLLILFGLLTFSYITHYYYLENAVQRWYKISNTIHRNMFGIGVNLYLKNSENPDHKL